MNIAAMQISVTDGIKPAIYFAIGVLLVEIIYVRLSLIAMNWGEQAKEIVSLAGMDNLVDHTCIGRIKFYCSIESHSKSESDIIEYTAPVLAWCDVKCNQSCSNPILVWVEYLIVHEITFIAP